MYRLYYYEVGHLLHDSFKHDCFDEVYLCQDDFLAFEDDMIVTNYFLILQTKCKGERITKQYPTKCFISWI